MHVTFEQAQQAIQAALRRAEELKTQMCIAVVDSGATLAKVFGAVCDAIQPVEGLGFALLTTFDSG